MKIRFVIPGLVVAAVALLVACPPYAEYALSSRDLEIAFVVIDAETGEPIGNTTIDLLAEEYREKGFDQHVINLVTDSDGRASYVHPDNSCEDVIRPFRRTKTLIDLTWASANISRKGYDPIEKMWLHTAKYENKGWFSEGHVQRVAFKVPLHRRPDN